MHHVEIVSRLEGGHVVHLEELMAAARAADDHEPIGEHKFLRLKQGDDLAIAILAYENGRLMGYAHTLTFGDGARRRVSCELVVHPDVRRNGIGSAVFEKVVDHARKQRASRLDLWAYNDSETSRNFAERTGLRETRRLLHMHRHPGQPPYLPDQVGVTVREFRPGADDQALLALNNRIFEDHPENGTWTMADLQARMAQTWFNPYDVLLLEVDDTLAGFCWLKIEDRAAEGLIGEVYVIGTAPEFQSRGLGRFILSKGLSHLHERKVDTVAVYVDQSNERGVALYWSLDFHHHHADALYSMALVPADEAEGESVAVA
jgi:mycothiol synthase